jgi:hypothetical protein
MTTTMKNQALQRAGRLLALSFILPFGLMPGAAGAETPNRPMVGVKIYEYAESFPKLFEEWRSLGINTAFVGAALGADPEFKALAKKNGITTFLIFPVFFDAAALEKDPGLYAVKSGGQRAEDDWVKFICPTREDYRSRKIEEAKRLVREVDPDVLSLDFMRFFVFWEKVYPDRTPDSLPDTCFDTSCLEAFEKEMNVHLPADLSGAETAAKAKWVLANHAPEWADWKCRTIAGMVKLLAAAAREVKPSIKINIHTVPWRKADFRGGIETIAGQDVVRLAPLVDYISPMCYHQMVRRTPAWVHSVAQEVYDRTHGRVLPSIQVDKAYIEDPYTLAQFKEAVTEALKPPSLGVVFWSWDALNKAPDRKEALKAVLGGPGRGCPRPSYKVR